MLKNSFRTRSLFVLALPVLLAALAGTVYAAWPHRAGPSGDDTPDGGVTVSEDTVHEALSSVQDRAGFAPLVPNYLPTEASKLVFVDASAGPSLSKNALHLIEFIYESAESYTVDGREIRSTLELFQTNVRLNEANGELLAPSLAGYQVHRDVVSRSEDGTPIKATYTARSQGRTLVMDFTGEQPDEDALEKMLGSLVEYQR